MNLLEAIQGAGENWFRPKRISGTGCAYSKNDSHVLFQCSDDSPEYIAGDDMHMSPLLEDLTDEWEIVTPEQVLSERKL